MFIELKDFNIVSYDRSNEDHRKFKFSLSSDDDFKRFFGQMFMNGIDEKFTESDSLEADKVYLVVKDSNIIGLVRLLTKNKEVVELQYAIKKDYRKNKLGSVLLTEFSSYLLDNETNKIILKIEKNNIPSIKCAINSGFEEKNGVYQKSKIYDTNKTR